MGDLGDLLDKDYLLSLGEIDPELKAVRSIYLLPLTIPSNHAHVVPGQGQPSTSKL